jgi:gamma-glutamylcyclotransferase (GGCT)/AIG2-like uncharacterized protein YtfP
MTNRTTAGSPHPYLPFFVYGTLLPGQPNFDLWRAHIVALRPARVRGFALLDLGPYPMMVRRPAEVVGMIAELERGSFPAVVSALDYLEGFEPVRPSASEYRRERHIALTLGGMPVAVWTYVGYPKTGSFPLVPGGDWKRHTRGQRGTLDAWWDGIATVGPAHQVQPDAGPLPAGPLPGR